MNESATACPRCRALVLPADHQEHDEWHDAVNKVLTQLAEAVEGLA